MPFLVGLTSSWPKWKVEGREIDAFVTTGDGDVLSTTDMALELDQFIAAKLPGCGIDFLEHLTESGPSVTAQQQLARTQ